MGRAFEYRKASKEKRWGKMSRIFPKLAKSITVAAKDGGIDPASNSKLRTAIINAKSENMPKDNIEAAIKRASGKDAANIMELHYEGKGPHGVLLFIECATDNGTRTIANVKSYFTKNGGEIIKNGSLDFMFERKSIFEIQKPNIDLEELELDLIDAGLEDMEVIDDILYISGDYKAFGTLSKAIEDLKLELKKATLERIPNVPVTFSSEQIIDIEKLIDKLDDDEDVQMVYTNIQD